MLTKAEARRLVRELERRYAEMLPVWDAAARERFFALPEYESARSVMAYVGVGAEPDTTELLDKVLSDGKRLLLPLTKGGGEMEARQVRSLTELVPGQFGIPEPPEPSPVGEPELVVVPGVAFDAAGGRLGRGKGYYDRWLASREVFTVALTREALLLPRVPAETWDRSVCCVVTEKRVIR